MNRHPVDLLSLIAGLAFVLFATASLVRAATGEFIDLGLMVPMALVGVGIAGLAGALRGSLSRSEDCDDETSPPAGV